MPRRTAPFPRSRTVGVLMIIAAAAFWTASAIHFGATIPLGLITLRDTFLGAATPEAIIGLAMGIGAAAVLVRWQSSRTIALGCTAFAVLATVYGLSVTLGSSRTADVIYHIIMLVVLIVVLSLAIAARPRTRPSASEQSE
jgi:hypothetical protein